MGPPKPPSPVPEGVEEESSPSKDVFKDSTPGQQHPSVSLGPPSAAVSTSEDIISVTRERNALRDQLQRVRTCSAPLAFSAPSMHNCVCQERMRFVGVIPGCSTWSHAVSFCSNDPGFAR